MTQLREKMETQRFLRSLAEARRRYAGAVYPDAETLDCQPWPPAGSARREPIEQQPAWTPPDLRPRLARRPAQEPTE